MPRGRRICPVVCAAAKKYTNESDAPPLTASLLDVIFSFKFKLQDKRRKNNNFGKYQFTPCEVYYLNRKLLIISI